MSDKNPCEVRVNIGRAECHHAFVSETNTDYVNLDRSQVEDLECDLHAEHALDQMKVTNKILDAFFQHWNGKR